MDTPNNSVTRLIMQLKAGQNAGVAGLWERYFRRLVGLARGKLPAGCRQATDDEDVALSAFASFCRGVDAGRFPRLDDRDNLWRVLLTIVDRKANRVRRYETRDKRDVRRRLDDATAEGLEQLIAYEVTPEFAAEVAEECQRLLDLLASDEIRTVAVLKMEGYSNSEIAERQNCAPRTVDRRLALIRETWLAQVLKPK